MLLLLLLFLLPPPPRLRFGKLCSHVSHRSAIAQASNMSAINQPTHGRGPASNFLRRNYNAHLFFDLPWVDRGAVCWLAPWICFAVFLWGKSQQRWRKCWPPTRGLAKDPQPAEEDCQVTRHGAEEQRGKHVCPPRQVWSLQSLTAARSPPGRAGPIPAHPARCLSERYWPSV